MKKRKILLGVIGLGLLFVSSCTLSSTIYDMKNGTNTTQSVEPTTTTPNQGSTSTEPLTSITGPISTSTSTDPVVTSTEPVITTTTGDDPISTSTTEVVPTTTTEDIVDTSTDTSTTTSTQGGGGTPSPTKVESVEVYENPSLTEALNANDLDKELEKIVFKVNYANSSFEYEKLEKTMILLTDYNNLLLGGNYEVTAYVASKAIKLNISTIKPITKHTVRFLAGDNVLKTEEVEEGSYATAPEDPEKFIDSDAMVNEFDGWDQEFTNVTDDIIVNAKFKKYNAVDVSVVLVDSHSADILVSNDELVEEYSVLVHDEDARQWAITQKEKQMSITSLTENGLHTIDGTLKYNGKTINIKRQYFETVGISNLSEIEYFVDENTISNTAITVDLSEYREKAPEGYVLKAVYLLNAEDDTFVAEHEVNDEENVVYFDDLTPDTEYKTSFMYDKDTSAPKSNQRHHNSPYPYRVTAGYAFYFVGFIVRTSNKDVPQRCVRIIYNDPQRGEKLLYRFYVSEGDSVSYSDWMYHNPFTFALPTIYNDYYAVGDYRELENVTEDKKVEVMMLPKNDTDAATHKVVFLDSNTHYLLGVEEIINHGSTTGPVLANDNVPEDTAKWHYEFKWDIAYHYGMYYGMIDLNDVTRSCVMMTGYSTFEKYIEPEIIMNSSMIYLGNGFVRTSINYNSYKAMIPYSADNEKVKIYQYLTEGSFMTYASDYPTEHIEPVSAETNNYTNGILFTGLDSSKYTLHSVIKYNLNDGTGDHIKTYRTTFYLSNSTPKHVELTLSSPNYQTITYEHTSDDKDIRIIRTIDSSEDDEYFETKVNAYYSGKKQEINSLLTNTTYRFYTAREDKSLIINVQKDNEVSATIVSYEFKKSEISSDYYTCTTLDGVEPTEFVLKIRAGKSTSSGHTEYYPIGYTNKDNRVQLYVKSYDTQIDIGPMRITYEIQSQEFDPYGFPIGRHMDIEFKFDAELGYYVPDSSWNFYQDLFPNNYYATDPETGQSYSYYEMVHYMQFFYFYNNSLSDSFYNKIVTSYDGGSKIKMEIID